MRDEIQSIKISPTTLIEEWIKTIENRSAIECSLFETASNVPDPSELSPENDKLMIFDNLLLKKQNKCECYYIRGRHSNVNCFYLSKNYFKLPRQTIRKNANLIRLFPQDLKNINHIYNDNMGEDMSNDHMGEDMSKDEFRTFCHKCWEKPHGFAIIDLNSKKHDGKYRNGFDNCYIPNSI